MRSPSTPAAETAERHREHRPYRRDMAADDLDGVDDELLNRVTWKIPNALALVGSAPATSGTA